MKSISVYFTTRQQLDNFLGFMEEETQALLQIFKFRANTATLHRDIIAILDTKINEFRSTHPEYLQGTQQVCFVLGANAGYSCTLDLGVSIDIGNIR